MLLLIISTLICLQHSRNLEHRLLPISLLIPSIHTACMFSGLQSRYGLPNMDFSALVSMFPDLEHEFVDSATSDECIADLVCHLKREAADYGAVQTMDW